MKNTAWLVPATLALLTTASAAPPKKKNAPPPKAPAKVAPAPLSQPVAPPPDWAVAFSPDGTRLAIGTYRRVLVLDTLTGAKQGDYPISNEAIRAIAFSPDNKLIAAGTGVPAQSGSAIVLDAATGQVVRTVKGHGDLVEAVAFSGPLLLTAADDEKVDLTDFASGKVVASLTEHVGRCLSVAVPSQTTDADGGVIFATGGADKAVKIWDAQARRVVVNFDQCEGAVWCLAASPRPGMFVAGSDDGKVRVFRVRADGDGRKKRAAGTENDPAARTGYLARTLEGHEGAVYAVAASPDSKFFVSGGADGKVIVWYENGGKRREWLDAQKDVWSVAISPDSKRVAAASLDGKTRVYDVVNGALLYEVGSDGMAIMAPPTVPTNAPKTPARVTKNTL